MKRFLAFAIPALMLLSCGKGAVLSEPSLEGMQSIRISAEMPGQFKAYVENGIIKWEDADCMAVFDGKVRNRFTLVSSTGNTAIFSGQISEGSTDLCAVFPYSDSATMGTDGNLTLSIPSDQTAGAHGIDTRALLTVAKSTVSQAHFSLKNVVSLVRMEVTEDGLAQISLKGSDPVQLTGKAVVNPSTGAAEKVKESANDYQITLSTADGCFAKGDYYIAMYPSEMASGTVVTLRGDKGKAIRTGTRPLNCTRSGIVSLGAISEGVSWAAAPEITGKAVKLLCLGNSFSEDGLEGWLYDIFKGEGIDAVIGNGYIGGCELATHWANVSGNSAAYSYRKIVDGSRSVTAGVTAKAMIQDENWDYIIFQQGGGNQGIYPTYEPYLTNLIQYCRENAVKKDFKVIFYANWAAAKDYVGAKFEKYDSDQMKMYNAISSACSQADEAHHFDLIANVGDAIQSGRTTFLGDRWNRDGWHLEKNYGRYCASCVFYEIITGKSCVGIKFHPATISDCVAGVCQNCAHFATLYRYRYMDLSWMENTDPTPAEEYRILAAWLFDKTVSISAGHQASWTGSSVPLGTQAVSNNPGIVGYMDANKEGSGRISYYQIDKTSMTEENAARYILNGTPGGQPAVCGQMGGDYWIIESTGDEQFSEGEHLQATFTVHPGKYGAKYWLLEYLDGTDWKPVYPVKSKNLGISSGIDVNSFNYNMEMPTNVKTDCIVDVVLTAPTPAFRIRLTCCSTYQVNDKYWTHPRNASEFRIAGTEADQNLPVLKLMFH